MSSKSLQVLSSNEKYSNLFSEEVDLIKKELDSFKQTVLTKFNENVSNVTFSDKIIKLI